MFEPVNSSQPGASATMLRGQDGPGWGTGIEGPLRVLVIEPDDGRRRQLLFDLRACGGPVEVREATGFIEGLGALRVDTYACVLVAKTLPDGDALAFVGVLRNTEASATPLIFVLDEEDQPFESAALDAGAEDAILRSDASGRTLRRSIRGAIARSRLKADLARAHSRLERIAVNEPLTGLLNQRGLEMALKREAELGLRKGVDNHLILVDLDGFKQVNERHGYDVGDRLLQEVARTLELTARRTDHVARIGGDEFLVLMPDSKLAAGLRLADRIRHRLEAIQIRSAKGLVTVTASLAVSRVPTAAHSVTDLVAEVGSAIQKGTSSGLPRITRTGEHRVVTTGNMRALGDTAQVDLRSSVFIGQPIANLETDEVLAHWVMAPRSPRPSAALGAQASLPHHDAIEVDTDRRQLEEAVQAAHDWDDGGGHYYFSAHPSTLIHTPTSRLKALFGGLDDSPGWGVMIGDHRIIGDPTSLVQPVRRLQDAGVRLGLRQVGFSRDSLEAIVLLRPRLVTLRIAHLLGPKREEQRVGMIRRLVRTLAELVPDIVLEGVLSEADRELAQELGIPNGVGSGVGDVFVLTNDGG